MRDRGIPAPTNADLVDGPYYVCARCVKYTRATHKPFARLTLRDHRGDAEAVRWDVTDAEWQAMQSPFIHVQGSYQRDHKGAWQICIRAVRALRTVERPSDFQPPCRTDRARDYHQFRELVLGVRDPHLRRLLRALFGAEEQRLRFCRAPASQTRHHAYVGGLLQHSVEVAGLCRDVAARDGRLDADLLVTGALLHDIGKLRELQCDSPGYEFSEDGGLLGHVMLGADMARDAMAGLDPPPPADLRGRVLHLILSHHGKKEWGAPVTPATPEAFVLHTCDRLSAQLFACREAATGSGERDLFVWAPSLESHVRAGTPAPKTVPLTPPGDGLEAALPEDAPDSEAAPRRPILRIVLGGHADHGSLPEMAALPVLGRIAAGSPIDMQEDLEGYMALPLSSQAEARDFLLKVRGDSMRDAHILDGDLVRIRPGVTARDGDIVAAVVNGNVTVKRLQRSGGRVVLQAENPDHPSIPIGPDDDLQIQGTVVSLIRERIC